MLEYIGSEDQSPSQDELVTFLAEEFDIEVDRTTVSRCLRRMKVTRKRGSRYHPNRDDRLRAEYITKIQRRYRANQLVVVDESATNEKDLDTRWGWSPRGTAYRMVSSTARRSKYWSILPAIGINGYLDVDIFQGSFNGDRFVLFIAKLLKKMNPFPAPRSVLIMDNARTHHVDGLREMCEDAGIVLEYLSPYSPHLSPIEESFSILKAWIRKYRKFALGFGDELFGLFLHIAVVEADLKVKARDLFKHCGYKVRDDDIDVEYSTLDKVYEVEEDL